MKYFIITGEASGDLHGANLASAIYKTDEQAEIKAWGGNKLRNVGATVTKDYSELAIMGFVEILTKLSQIKKNFSQAVNEINSFQPDAIILVDFSGFNLRLAKKLKKNGFTGKIFYYISPKLWVWNSKRVKSVKKYIDAMFCILPFEVDFYESHEYNHSFYIGNPLMDEIDKFEQSKTFLVDNNLPKSKIVALLPGSRKNEIEHVLPTMLSVVNEFPNYQFVIAGVDSMKQLIEKELNTQNISLPIIYDQTYDLVTHADAALVTSGTATLETVLLKTPLILCYKGNMISFAIAKWVVNLKYIGLPNLILDKMMIKELIQKEYTKATVTEHLNNILTNSSTRKEFFDNQILLAEKVGSAGASQKAASKMIELLNN